MEHLSQPSSTSETCYDILTTFINMIQLEVQGYSNPCINSDDQPLMNASSSTYACQGYECYSTIQLILQQLNYDFENYYYHIDYRRSNSNSNSNHDESLVIDIHAVVCNHLPSTTNTTLDSTMTELCDSNQMDNTLSLESHIPYYTTATSRHTTQSLNYEHASSGPLDCNKILSSSLAYSIDMSNPSVSDYHYLNTFSYLHSPIDEATNVFKNKGISNTTKCINFVRINLQFVKTDRLLESQNIVIIMYVYDINGRIYRIQDCVDISFKYVNNNIVSVVVTLNYEHLSSSLLTMCHV